MYQMFHFSIGCFRVLQSSAVGSNPNPVAFIFEQGIDAVAAQGGRIVRIVANHLPDPLGPSIEYPDTPAVNTHPDRSCIRQEYVSDNKLRELRNIDLSGSLSGEFILP